MHTPSDQIHGSPSSHIVVRKLANGEFEARNVSMPLVKAAVHADEITAIRQCAFNTEQWIGSGCPQDLNLPDPPDDLDD